MTCHHFVAPPRPTSVLVCTHQTSLPWGWLTVKHAGASMGAWEHGMPRPPKPKTKTLFDHNLIIMHRDFSFHSCGAFVSRSKNYHES